MTDNDMERNLKDGTMLVAHGAGKRGWYQASIGAAVVAGLFSLVVLVFMVTGYLEKSPEGVIQVEGTGPLDSPELAGLKRRLEANPMDEALKRRIRGLDLQIRRRYFHQRDRVHRGGYLLLAGVAVLLLSLKYAAGIRKQPPVPEPEAMADPGVHRAGLARGRRAVALAGLLLAAGALALALAPEVDLASLPPEPREEESRVPAAAHPSKEEIQGNWPRFRGPGGLGVSPFANAPLSWDGSTGEGILWKAEVPLYGHNSPIVWEDRVFLSGADESRQEVYCYDAGSGELLWRREVPPPPGGRQEEPEIMEDTGYAASTMACDHERAYAIFATGDVAAFTFNGEPAWIKYLGLPESIYGFATSLLMHEDRLMIQFDQGEAGDDLSRLLAIEGATGRMAWQKRRPVANAWTTPIVIDTGEEEQIVTCSDPLVIAYDPKTGEERWRADLMGADTAPSPVYARGMVFVIQPNDALFAIRIDGRGDVTESHVAWTNYDNAPDICSPVCNDEFIFLLNTMGLLTCHAVETGEMLFEHDFEEDFQSSPTLVEDRVYLLSQDGVMHIIEAAAGFREIGRAELHEGSTCSPAFKDGRIYIRGFKHLFCVGGE